MKRRLFFKVENVADADAAIKICYQIFYLLAAIQAVLIVTLFAGASYLNFFDPVLMLILAWFIHHKKSRTAATILGIYTIFIAVLTFGNRMGIYLGGFGGKNIMLALIALYGIYKGVQGTFRYHQLVKHEVIWRNVWKMLGLTFLYNIVFLGILMLVPLHPNLEQKVWGYGEDAFSDEVIGGAGILCILLASAGTAFRVLPWTKNKPLIAIKKVDAH